MSPRAAHALAPLLLEDADLRTARLAIYDADDIHVRDVRGAGQHFAAVLFEHEHLVDGHFVAVVGVETVDVDHVAGADFHLTAAALDYCEHFTTPESIPTLGSCPTTGLGKRFWRNYK